MTQSVRVRHRQGIELQSTIALAEGPLDCSRELVRCLRAAVPAVGVHRNAIAHWTAKEFVHRDTEPLALDVPEGLLDCADRREYDGAATFRPERVVVHLGPKLLDA